MLEIQTANKGYEGAYTPKPQRNNKLAPAMPVHALLRLQLAIMDSKILTVKASVRYFEMKYCEG